MCDENQIEILCQSASEEILKRDVLHLTSHGERQVGSEGHRSFGIMKAPVNV